MSNRSRRKPPSHRKERAPGLDPDIRRLIDLLTEGCPEYRPAVYEAAGALDSPDLREAFAAVAPAQRAGLLLAWRAAVRALGDRKPCDFCDAIATRVRFVVVKPGDDFRAVSVRPGEALTGFVI